MVLRSLGLEQEKDATGAGSFQLILASEPKKDTIVVKEADNEV
jgi:hypothetical protein